MMLAFIDESGDVGFKLDSGSSAVFVCSMVIFTSHEHADRAEAEIRQLARRLKISNEFKFNKSSPATRDEFIQLVTGLDFTCRSIVVDKSTVGIDRLAHVKEDFHRYFLRLLIEKHDGHLKDANLFIDGSGHRQFQKELRSYVRANIPPGVLQDVRLRDSKSSPLIQMADMLAGAVARAHTPIDPIHRWLRPLIKARKMSDIWLI